MRNLVISALCLVLVGVGMALQLSAPPTQIADAPAAKLPDLAGYAVKQLEISEAERTVLPADTQIEKRLYTDDFGNWFAVSLVIGGKSKNSIHRPELCLPSQGFLMSDPRTISVGDVEWRSITLVGGPGRPNLGFAYTFFNQAGYRTSSHIRRIFMDVWDRSVYSRVDRWAMLTVNASRGDSVSMYAFLSKLGGVIP